MALTPLTSAQITELAIARGLVERCSLCSACFPREAKARPTFGEARSSSSRRICAPCVPLHVAGLSHAAGIRARRAFLLQLHDDASPQDILYAKLAHLRADPLLALWLERTATLRGPALLAELDRLCAEGGGPGRSASPRAEPNAGMAYLSLPLPRQPPRTSMLSPLI